MFFPLGLGFKTKDFPYATWLIISICVFFYALGQQKEQYQSEYFSLKAHDQLERAHDHLFYEYCLENLGNVLCEQFAMERNLYTDGDEEIPFGAYGFETSANSMLEFMGLYDEFRHTLDENPTALQALPSYASFMLSQDKLSEQIQKIRVKYNLLHHDNLNFIAIILAIFSHDNIPHLIGNMLFLFIFGRYVEARVGRVMYLVSYLILGSIALSIYAYYSPDKFLHVLGASANVSVIMGAFYVLFFNQRLKIFFFYLVSKVASFPVKTYMFLFFMLQEFVFSLTAQENVAYLAHAIGLVLGCGFGYAYKKLRPVPREFLYEDEVKQWEFAKSKISRVEFIEESLEILKYNPNNKVVIKALIKEIAPEKRNLTELDLDEELLLRQLIPGYLKELYRNKEYISLYDTVERIPRSWSLSTCLSSFSQKKLISLIDQSIDDSRLFSSVLFIQAFLERYKNSPKQYNLLKTLNSILDHMDLNHRVIGQLEKIKNLSSSSPLKQTLQARIDQTRL